MNLDFGRFVHHKVQRDNVVEAIRIVDKQGFVVCPGRKLCQIEAIRGVVLAFADFVFDVDLIRRGGFVQTIDEGVGVVLATIGERIHKMQFVLIDRLLSIAQGDESLPNIMQWNDLVINVSLAADKHVFASWVIDNAVVPTCFRG